jgi:hypothetical protein
MKVCKHGMIRCAVGFSCLVQASSFNVVAATSARPHSSRRSSCLAALTERQMQFWEDVDEGLIDVEQVYSAKGQDIDRIRKFGKR